MCRSLELIHVIMNIFFTCVSREIHYLVFCQYEWRKLVIFPHPSDMDGEKEQIYSLAHTDNMDGEKGQIRPGLNDIF